MFKPSIRKLEEYLLFNDSSLFLFYLKHFRKFSNQSIARFIDDYLKTKPNAFLIQIGANDGFSNDPIVRLVKKYCLEGILLEPQPKVFQLLKKCYQNYPHLYLENAAMSIENGEKTFYEIAFSNKRWATGIATFDKTTLEKQISRGYVKQNAIRHGDKLPKQTVDYIKKSKVRTITFQYILEKYKRKQIDIIQIDTEGYDFEILKMIPFKTIKPEIIVYENEHLSTQDRTNAENLLKDKGYSIYNKKTNTLATTLSKELNSFTKPH